MANICSFSMCVKGKRISDIEQFYDAMSQNGNIYMGRGAEAEIKYAAGKVRAYIDGWCKWSIQSALIDNAISMRWEPERWAFHGVNVNELEFVTLLEATKKWNLVVEVYSEEPGCEFQEHYIFDNGIIVEDECVEYCEFWLDDYDTKEEAEEAFGFKITDEEWESGDIICRGGFEEWEFVI